jgi:ABC-type enterochelin transport system substrate-binding protein
VLINSQKVNYRRWTTCLVLLTVLALSSCGKKSDEPTASNSTDKSTAQSSAPTTSTTTAKDPTATPTSKSSKSSTSKSAALSADVKKLGVEPKGTDCPSNAPIKGNLNNKGNKIYHQAKEANYQKVKPEICFADVATAEKAGFRAPKAAK